MKTKTDKNGKVQVILHDRDRQSLAVAADVLARHALLCFGGEDASKTLDLRKKLCEWLEEHAETPAE